jgi:hypothetical protein
VKRGAEYRVQPGPAWRKRLMPALALTGVLLVGVGCRDGYSTGDQQATNPSVMTEDQLLAEMNQLGAQPHLGRTWRYRLRPGCVLEVTVGSVIGTGDERVVPLARATIDSLFDAADKTYDVRVLQASSPDANSDGPSALVLENGKWTDSVTMRSLLQYLQRRCVEAEAPKP